VSIFQTPHTCIHTSPVLILKLPSPYGKSQASGAGDEADSAACVVDEGWVLAGDAIEEAPELAGLVELALLRASPSRLRLAAHSRLRVQLPPRPAASALPRAAASTPSRLRLAAPSRLRLAARHTHSRADLSRRCLGFEHWHVSGVIRFGEGIRRREGHFSLLTSHMNFFYFLKKSKIQVEANGVTCQGKQHLYFEIVRAKSQS
jgi:hypothetical protein